jgi:1-acyl-sn-glycerol-3-phosphate acyltransferase
MNMRWFRFTCGRWRHPARALSISAASTLRDQPPVIIAPNHPSLLDAVMVISRLPNIVCIMKTELMNNLSCARARGWPATSATPRCWT